MSFVGLRADHFDVLDPEPKNSRLDPGTRIDFQVDFGELVSCDEPAPQTATAVIAYATETDPAPRQVEVPLDTAPLDEIRDRECGQRRVLDAVDIGFGGVTRTDTSIAADVVLTRRSGDEPVTVHNLRGTEIFSMLPPLAPEAEPAGPLAVLSPGETELRVPVTLEVLRCDPHAVGQSTRTYEFKLWISVGDTETQFMVLDPSPELRTELDTILGICLENTVGD